MIELVPRSLRHATFRCRATAVLASSAALLVAAVPMAAADTPTYGGGDCWRSNTPTLCQQSPHWRGANNPVYWYVENDVGSQRPTWATGIQAASDAWENSHGPQVFSTTYSSSVNPITIHINFSQTGQHDLDPDNSGVTWSCPKGGACTDSFAPLNIYYVEIYLNYLAIDGTPGAYFNYVVTHELGHAQGLAHNDTGQPTVMASTADPNTPSTYMITPTAQDYGSSPPCNVSSPGGIGGVRCIYDSVGS